MKYVTWLWGNSKGIRLNALVCIVAGIASVVLGLLMVWLSKRFIDATTIVIVLVIAATHIGQTLWISQHDTELATPATSSADASSI